MNGLDFQIVIEGRNLNELLLTLPFHDCPDKLARFAGRANDDAIPIFLNDILGQTRTVFIEVFYMG